jgi:hypothetical protein
VEAGEEVVMVELPALNANVILICHVSKDKSEVEGTSGSMMMARGPLAQGRLLDTIGSQWPEIWRVYPEWVGKEGEMKKVRYLQTEADKRWQAETQLALPDPCPASFKAVWDHAKVPGRLAERDE